MNTKVVLIGIASFLGATMFLKILAAKRLNYFVQKVSFRFEGINPVMSIILGVQNPTRETITVGSIFGNLYINNNFVGTVYGFVPTTISGLSLTSFPISARLSLTGLLGEVKDIVTLITNGTFSAILNQVVSFKGSVNAEGLNMPLNFDYKVL